MKHLILSLLTVTTANFMFAQSLESTDSKGTQAQEESMLVPHTQDDASVLIQPRGTDHQEGALIKQDHKKDRKNALREFLVNRATKKFQRALNLTAAKGTNHGLDGVLYIFLVVILVLLILSLLEVFLPFEFVYVLALVFLILLVLWLLDAI